VGGIAQFALSQMDPSQQAALIQSTAPQAAPDQGSTADLENRAAAAPQQLFDAQQQIPPQPKPQPGQWSSNNPIAPMAQDYQARYQASAPAKTQTGPVKNLLTNFFGGMGASMMHEAGLPTPTMQRQQLFENYTRAAQLADQWESQNSDVQYRNAVIGQMQQNQLFQQQEHPLQLQRMQLENTAAQNQNTAFQQNQPTVHPAMTPQDLQSMGLSPAMAQQYAGKPLSSADMAALREISVGAAKHPYDYGQDGSGPGKGIWLVDAQFNPIKQLSPTSETGRATSLAKQQQALQLQMGTAGQQGIDIVEGRLDPSQVSPRASNYPMILNAANQYSQQRYGQPFDFSKAASDYKFANNPTTKNTLNYLNSLTGPDGRGGNLQEVVNLSDQVGRTSFPALNDVAAWTRMQAGSPIIAQYHAAVTEVADQVAKIMQGGGSGTSDAKMKQAMDLFQTGFNPAQIKGVASTLQGLLQNRKTSMIGNNSYLQRWYGQGQTTPSNPSISPTSQSGFNWNSAPLAQ
jgi:hypothetical protein